MSRRLRITDEVTFEPIITNSNTDLKDNIGSPGQHLLVRIAATHAGIITGNNTFYLPDRMRKGASTWTAQYNKPVLVHHDAEKDAIGRVVSASYVDLSSVITAEIKNSIHRESHLMADSLKRFLDGQLSRKGEVEFICDVLSKNKVLDDKNYKGLGYCEIIASITDPEAIQKIRDGRYLTGSVSASTDGATCSICQSDWIEDGKCEHKPGEIYDEQRAFLIAGDFEYEEYSYVNRPADVHSRNLELVTDGKAETIAIHVESKENTKMSEDKKSVVKDQETIPEVQAEAPVVAALEVSENKVEVKDESVPEPIIDATPSTESPTTECSLCKVVSDKVLLLEAENIKLNDHLRVLREEMKLLHKESADVQDELVNSRLESRTNKARHLLDLKKINGTEIKDEVAELSSLIQLDDKQLNTQVESVDIKKIIDRLSSGLANNPEGTVSNPSVIADKQTATQSNPEATELAKKVQDTYDFICAREGAAQANLYLERMRQAGYTK